MTRIEVRALVQENGAVCSLVAAQAAIVIIIEDTLVDLIMGAQTETAEAAWKIVSEQNSANRTVDRLRPQFEAAFPGVTLP